MFSYRHAFHAGNHADVLKHIVLMQIIDYMVQKDTPLTVVDTHAGAGMYELTSAWAQKSGEAAQGVGLLWGRKNMPPAIRSYLGMLAEFNQPAAAAPSGSKNRGGSAEKMLRYYPGSPAIASACLRTEDKLRLYELLPADARLLTENVHHLNDAFDAATRAARLAQTHAGGAASADSQNAESSRGGRRGKRIMVTQGDGFSALKALLPPPSRRALVLIDPPYEDKNDYRKVKDVLEESLGRFPSGTYAVWYPLLNRMESRELSGRLQRVAKEWLDVTLTVRGPTPDGTRLHSSGMFIVNPPYTLLKTLEELMPVLTEMLAQDDGAAFVIRGSHAPETMLMAAEQVATTAGGTSTTAGTTRLPPRRTAFGRTPASAPGRPPVLSPGLKKPAAEKSARVPGKRPSRAETDDVSADPRGISLPPQKNSRSGGSARSVSSPGNTGSVGRKVAVPPSRTRLATAPRKSKP